MNAPAFGFAKPARPLDLSRFVRVAQMNLREEGFSGAANDAPMILKVLQQTMDACADRNAGDDFAALVFKTAMENAGYVILSRSKAVSGLFVQLARQFQTGVQIYG